MVRARWWLKLFVLFAVADIVVPLIENKTLHDLNNDLKGLNFRRKGKKKVRSTSSSSGDRKDSDEEEDDSGQSLDLTISDSEEESDRDGNKRGGYNPKSSAERRGWRKWHRKCPPCPEDMVKKWRDRSIRWICGGYQRARRSFKSECMMYYRNCQDGTMFVKIHDHRCKNDTENEIPRGLHFFYEYGRDSQASKTQSESESAASMDFSNF